jgi:hypothetical protein
MLRDFEDYDVGVLTITYCKALDTACIRLLMVRFFF